MVSQSTHATIPSRFYCFTSVCALACRSLWIPLVATSNRASFVPPVSKDVVSTIFAVFGPFPLGFPTYLAFNSTTSRFLFDQTVTLNARTKFECLQNKRRNVCLVLPNCGSKRKPPHREVARPRASQQPRANLLFRCSCRNKLRPTRSPALSSKKMSPHDLRNHKRDSPTRKHNGLISRR